MAIPKMNPSSVYLMVADSAGLYGMFHSTNYGDGHWSADDLGTCAVRPTPRCSALAASPTNSNLLLAGGYSSQACRSIDGGRSWSQLGPGAASLHWDHTAIAFNDSGRAFIGGDGGIAYSTDRDAGSWATKGMGLHAPTVVSFDISATDPHYQYMATWDTGLWATNGGAAWISTQQDTFDIEADPTNAQLAWAAIGPGGEDRFATVDGGLHFDPFNGNLGSSPSAGRIRTNGRSSLLTAGGRAVFSTTVPATPRPSGGIPAPHWTRWPNARTPDFSGNIAGLTVNRPGDGVQLFVYAWIGRNPDQSPPRNKLYVFDSRSFAWRVSGTRADGTEYFPAPILQLATSADGRLAYAITEDNSIFASSDYGESWNSAAGSNPPAEMWDVLIDPTNPSRVFVAAAGGVYQSYQSTTPRVWRNWSLGLPFVNGAGTHFARLRAAASGGTTYLYATVLGRGIFRREITADP